MSELLALLGSKFLRKTRIFNFKSAVSQPITGVKNFGKFQKNEKNTKIEQNFKNVKSDLRSFLHRYGVISSEI